MPVALVYCAQEGDFIMSVSVYTNNVPVGVFTRQRLQRWRISIHFMNTRHYSSNYVLVEFIRGCLDMYKHARINQMKHQLDATLCRFYFCRVTLHVSGASAQHQEYLKLVQRPLVHVLSLQVSHHISLLGPEALIRRCDDF